VCTALPRHATSAGMPTLTDTSVGTAASDDTVTLQRTHS
jgi:hypothetical protein